MVVDDAGIQKIHVKTKQREEKHGRELSDAGPDADRSFWNKYPPESTSSASEEDTKCGYPLSGIQDMMVGLLWDGLEDGAYKRIDLLGNDDPEKTLGNISKDIRKRIKLLRCFDYPKVNEIEASFTGWYKNAEAEVQKELACRASKECMLQRYALQICMVIEERRQAAAEMAEIKKYARISGVLPRGDLNDLADKLRILDGNIAQMKVEYKQGAGKEFLQKICR
jgi:hypothetical protein